jgi:hypothetical protein
MSKMTGGPWEARFDVDETDEEQKWIVKSAANKLVNDGYIIALFGGPDAEANCKGAAALPDLIEAAEQAEHSLKCIIEIIDANGVTFNNRGQWEHGAKKALGGVRSALLKAKGGEG